MRVSVLLPRARRLRPLRTRPVRSDPREPSPRRSIAVAPTPVPPRLHQVQLVAPAEQLAGAQSPLQTAAWWFFAWYTSPPCRDTRAMMAAMHRRRVPGAWVRWSFAALLAIGGASVARQANAAVSGRRGIEIEGAQDRRGFYVGGGFGFGGTFFWYDDFFPAARVDLVLGGGITKRLTLGADLHVTPYLSKGGGVAFGGDIEATAYVFRGLYLRAALGAAGVPKRESRDEAIRRELTAGLGGAVGFGYEFFVNSTAAIAAGFTYDARFVPGSRFPRQGLLVGLRFTWY